jgi:hypothetical protein
LELEQRLSTLGWVALDCVLFTAHELKAFCLWVYSYQR